MVDHDHIIAKLLLQLAPAMEWEEQEPLYV